MNREILFRGKLLNGGKWSYGNLVVKLSGVSIITPDDTPLGKYGQVDQITVGQYTGLTDKNGKKIFEGDIIKTKKYGRDMGHSNMNGFDIFTVIYEPCSFFLDNKNRRFVLADDGFSKFEIIGNIHDNPELLGGEKK